MVAFSQPRGRGCTKSQPCTLLGLCSQAPFIHTHLLSPWTFIHLYHSLSLSFRPDRIKAKLGTLELYPDMLCSLQHPPPPRH